MRKYLSEYIKITENKLKGTIKEKDIEELLNKISFFSHERFIHLIVTMFFALFSLLFIYVSFSKEIILLYIISFILLIVLLFYIIHYFFFFFNVQYLYKLYDEMNKKLK